MVLDFNRQILSATALNIAINDGIERASQRAAQPPRAYLGASIVGHACARKAQFDWQCEPAYPSRLRDIFDRGHFFEKQTHQHMIFAGFCFAPDTALAFTAAGGLFRGHADGILIAGPRLFGVGYPCLWEHKAINAKWWRLLERDGLEKTYPQYAAQVALYQAYLEITENPAIFTAVNADTCERLHLLVPFDAERAQTWSDRAVTIIEATRAGELLPRFTDDPTDWRCKMCGHHERCWR
jgi:hypothetical protein